MKIAQSSVHLVDHMGSDLSVVNAARVSFNKESEWERNPFTAGDGLTQYKVELSNKDVKLVSYLAKHGHWSPFAHNSLTFRISAPIFVARQLVKHQVGGVWNEVSRRYVDNEPEFYFPDVYHGKPVNAKQGASDEALDDAQPEMVLSLAAQHITQQALNNYTDMIAVGVAPEEARMFLPLNTMTEWWWTGSLMFFARVCKQRLDPHAQNATRHVAQMINDKIPDVFQHSWKALMEG